MKNRFSAEYATLHDYIIGITEQIWEGRQIDLIRRYYSPDCWLLTPSGIVTGVEAVITGTKATLAMFPDRELLGEDVIWSNDGQKRGLLSSHRIISPMTHRGDGVFGKATGRTMRIRTIADCLVVGDVITEEWLVRDQGAMALAASAFRAEGGRMAVVAPSACAALSMGIPCAAARRNSRRASTSSFGPPRPSLCMAPRLYWDSSSPCAAARRNSRRASTSSFGPPSP
jgi:hypothetical protein